jgi:ketosteroid isomerase-like protein
MRKPLFLVGILILVVGFDRRIEAQTGHAQQTVRSQAEKEVLQASEAVDEAIRQKNTDALASILSDDLEYTNQFGELLSKTQWLANIRSGKLTTVTLLHDVAGLHVFENSAVLIGISHTTFVYDGKPSDTPRRFTRFFVKQNGSWRLVAQHVCVISGQ